MATCMAEDRTCTAPLWKYTVISVVATAASLCQYEALKYVSFTVQMLGKSVKMLPVMLYGAFWAGKAYAGADWLTAAVLTGGVTEFLLTGTFRSAANPSGPVHGGLLYLLGFVLLDALTSSLQERLLRPHMTSKYRQMLQMNLASACIALAMMLMSGHSNSTLDFCGRHQQVVGDIALLSVVAVMAQWFIYCQVQEFGALVFSATMNARQVASIVASYLAFKHRITLWQIIGLAIIATTLCGRSTLALFTDRADEERAMLKPSDARPGRPSIFNSGFFKKTKSGCCPGWKV
uniref:Sugar phosphate transporter domain-containing protein n=1 Tax=Alexandrium catenella TaxID=2925 RepID=A0A7S1LEF9_ALECA